MQKWADLRKINVFSSWNMEIASLEILFKGVIHMT